MRYTNPLKRFFFRRDLYKRIRNRLSLYQRRLAKDELPDLARLLQEDHPKVILDVGANVGFLTWQFHKLFQEATIYALEPDPTPFRALQSTHGSTPRIRPFQVAAADKDVELDFWQRSISRNSSLLQLDVPTGSTAGKPMKVRACALDRFCAEQSIVHIDLLKVDTEGADLLVLHGAKGMLAQGRVDVVMTEIFFVPTYQGQPSFEDISGFLKAYGFRLFNLYIGYETQRGQVCYGNAIFIGTRLQKKFEKDR